MNPRTLLLSLAVALFGISGTAVAADYTHSTPAVQGYDVVTYHTNKRPLRGTGHFTANHDGATYQFSSKENQALFEANPEKYVPAYNGYCAFGVSVGKKFLADPEVFRVVNGVTYLNLDSSIQDEWLKDPAGRIKSADSKWRKIKKKNPASL